MRQSDVNRIGRGLLMIEFGVAEDRIDNSYILARNYQQADRHSQSWIFWQCKFFQDITTATPVGESLFKEQQKCKST
jgi:hypothetical protein